MKVFLAGGTGVLGRRALPALVAAGHDVSVLVRTDAKAAQVVDAKAAQVVDAGATPVRCSLFDPDALRSAVAGHGCVVNLATHIPSVAAATRASAWAENDRIRTEGARNLVDAALAEGVGRHVQESIAFLYADGGDGWIDEDQPFMDPPIPARASVEAAEREAARVTDAGGAGVVLRFGMFHAADSDHTRSTLLVTRWGFSALPGPDGLYLPIIHVDDAAEAVVAALDVPAGTYNVVDDEPVTRLGYARAWEQALDDPGRIALFPSVLARGMVRSVPQLGVSQRVSNGRFRQATGWSPRFPSAREATAEIVRAAREPRRLRSRGAALALLVLTLGSLLVGLWALGAPQSFHDSFPGFGRVWVAPEGPFNEHLLRDVGALNLALAAVSGLGLASMTLPLVRAAAVANLLFGVPHLLFHLTHLAHFEAADRIGISGSLTVPVVAAAAVLVLSARRGPPAPVAGPG